MVQKIRVEIQERSQFYTEDNGQLIVHTFYIKNEERRLQY